MNIERNNRAAIVRHVWSSVRGKERYTRDSSEQMKIGKSDNDFIYRLQHLNVAVSDSYEFHTLSSSTAVI